MAIVREYRPKLEENGLVVMNENGCFRPSTKKICSSSDAVNILEAIGLREEPEEYFVVLCMNTNGQVIGFFRNSSGCTNACFTSTRECLRKALLLNAVSVIIAHNHPGGSCNPSKEDINLTKTMKEAFNAIDIRLLDHIIIPSYSSDYYSFTEHGEI